MATLILILQALQLVGLAFLAGMLYERNNNK